jgi:acyl carrier protein
MKISKEQVITIILSTLNDLIETLPNDQRFKPEITTKLFGEGSPIDSLTLVSFIVELEAVFSTELNTEIVLTDDRAMTREKSPFESADELANYIVEITE